MTTNVVIETGAAGSDSLEAHKVRAYAKNVWRAAERTAMLTSTVMSDLNFSEAGKAFTDNTYNRSGPKDVADEFTSHDVHRIKKGSRQATFGHKYDSSMVGRKEEAEELVDPTNEHVFAQGEGLGTFRDQFILQSLFADVQEATDGGTDVLGHQWTTISFPAGMIVPQNEAKFYKGKADGDAPPASADQGLTVPKLFKARSLLSSAKMKGERCFTCSEDDILNLLTSTLTTSKDYNKIEALYNGEITRFMGFNFKVVHPDVQTGWGTNAAQCAAYVKQAFKYNERQLVTARVHERKDMHNNWEAYYRFQPSGLRRDDTSVVQILTNHTPVAV